MLYIFAVIKGVSLEKEIVCFATSRKRWSCDGFEGIIKLLAARTRFGRHAQDQILKIEYLCHWEESSLSGFSFFYTVTCKYACVFNASYVINSESVTWAQWLKLFHLLLLCLHREWNFKQKFHILLRKAILKKSEISVIILCYDWNFF
jgi:hypothetical protein